MLRFISQRSVPPGGMYFYQVPETKAYFRHPTMQVLLAQVQAHLTENTLPIPPDLEARVQDQMCHFLPEGFCFGDTDKPRQKFVSLADIRKATADLHRGNTKVDPGEAERRARTCSNCSSNDRAACTSCTGMTEWARKLVGATLSGLDSALGICKIDCTALSAKVHLSRIPDSAEYPENCWRAK